MTTKFRRLVAPATDGTYVPPTGYTWPFPNYEYINKDPAGGDRAPMDTSVTGSVANNPGSFFVAFQDDASSSFANRPHWALSMNTDVIDDELHRPIALAATRVATTGSGGSTIVLTSGWIWCGDGDDTDPDDFIRITLRYAGAPEQDIFFLDGTTPHRAKCIDILQDSSSVVEAGMIEASPAHPVTLVFDTVVIFEVWLYYATRASLALTTRAVGSFVRHMLRPSELSYAAMDILGRIIDTSGMDLYAAVPITLAGTVTALAGKGGKDAVNTWTMLNIWENESRYSKSTGTNVWVLIWHVDNPGGSGNHHVRYYKNKYTFVMVTNASVSGTTWTADDTTKSAYMTTWDSSTGKTESFKLVTTTPWTSWDDNAAASCRAYKKLVLTTNDIVNIAATAWTVLNSSTVGYVIVQLGSVFVAQTLEVLGAVSVRNASSGSAVEVKAQVQVNSGGWVDVPGTLRTFTTMSTSAEEHLVSVAGMYDFPSSGETVQVRLVSRCSVGTNLFSVDCFLRARVEQISAY